MTSAFVIAIAMLLDAALGEPKWLWQRLSHPAVLMGRVIAWSDETFNHGENRRLKGIMTMGLLVLSTALLGWLLSLLGPVVEIILIAILIAQRSLVQHVAAVTDGLRLSLPQGRRDVAMIVGRDTKDMSEPAVARAAIESAAENLSDGVIAPLFWALLLGLPGILIYKIVNTADSMIGYRTPRHEAFGWAAARLDDVLNWVPARLTAVLIALTSKQLTNWPAIAQDARQHRSPNAGWPEAAMARAISVALAGPRAYDGVMQEFARVNESGAKDIGPSAISSAVSRLWQAWATMLGAILLIALATV